VFFFWLGSLEPVSVPLALERHQRDLLLKQSPDSHQIIPRSQVK